MNEQWNAEDNISELLLKVLEFTKVRRQLLTENINQMHKPGFEPKDLAIDDFSMLLNEAIDEHVRNHRLVLRDTETVRFGRQGSVEMKPVLDTYSADLLKNNKDKYLETQVSKLLENSINQRLTGELLKQKEQMAINSD